MLIKAGKNAISVIRKNKAKFQSQLLLVISAFAFLGSSVLYQINLTEETVDFWAKISNFISGTTMTASAYLLVVKEDREEYGKHQGYVHFEQVCESIDH
jgi:hypothetical protein